MLCFSSVINRMRRLTDEKRIRQASRAPVSALIRRWLAVAAGNRSGWLAVGWSGVGAMVGRWWGDGGAMVGRKAAQQALRIINPPSHAAFSTCK
jgi:hypothetical protein